MNNCVALMFISDLTADERWAGGGGRWRFSENSFQLSSSNILLEAINSIKLN